MSLRSSLTPTLAHMHMHMHMHMPLPLLVLVLVAMLTFERIRIPVFQASRSEAVGGRAKQRPVHIPSARAEERSFSRIRAARV
ncbi:hypothetical protein [Variovorax sp. B2]|uniref:hypothetical protein n=1 Tax=Variovorax sp. B2 TaxID=2021406 RepID=UPI000CCA1ED5|nr:hypothetical protein [Variovorax sp. B2]PNG46810.1 hypothetical protein CHC06_07153 [Variovorax sp. B2]VTV14623.1 hypothetical protein WDL1CHR_05127 [Variovorax sp. WDL1]